LRNHSGADDAIVDAVRNGGTLPDAKLDALVSYVRSAVESRGFVDESNLQAFLDAGYTKQNVLEVNLIIALKTISNYTNHLAETPLDEPFQPEKLEFATA
jgi:alkylhydroperoxidase family enzyme